MDPVTIMALLQVAGMLGGAFGLGRRRDRSTEELLRLVAQYSTPEQILADATKYYNGYLQSPAYSAGRTGISLGANRIASDTAGSMAMRGMTGSGVGAILGALGSNTAGFKLADLRNNAWMSALQTASGVATSRLQGAGYLKGPRDIGLDVGAGLMDWLGKIDPRMFGGPKPKPASNAAYYNPRPQDAIANWAQLMGRPRQ